MKKLIFFILLYICQFSCICQSQTIVTIAGNGSISTGFGDAATATGFGVPICVVQNRAGDLFISENEYQNYILKIDTGNRVWLVCGGISGTFGYSGDGGPATAALLHQPCQIAFDSSEKLAITDLQNNRVRQIDFSTGLITTIAGNGGFVPGDLVDSLPATSFSLPAPGSVAYDQFNNLYVGSVESHQIFKIGVNGYIHRFAGTGSTGFSGDGGPASAAQLIYPEGLIFDKRGRLYFSDWFRIRCINLDGEITTFAGNGDSLFNGEEIPATDASIWPNLQNAIDSNGAFFFADRFNNRIRMVDTCGYIRTVVGNGVAGFAGDDSAALNAEINTPFGVNVDGMGNLLVADALNNRIRKITPVSDTCSHGGLAVKQPTAPAGAGLRLSPNPTYGMLKISAPWPVEALEVVDALGRTVLQRTFGPAYRQEADLGSLSPGVYCAIVNGGARKMFVKE